MQEFIESWGYLGVFLGILASGLGLPIPEELPIVIGGSLAGTHPDEVPWYYMLPVCIVGVIIGDCSLYLIGRYWGSKLVQLKFVRKHLLTPEKFMKISENFQKYGVKILLFARLTPGIRAPIFLTAGITHLPLTKFLIADAIYAIPGVSLLFFLGFWFTNNVIDLIHSTEHFRPVIVLLILGCICFYLLFRALRKPVVTGAPAEMPVIVGQVTETIDHAVESMADKVMHRSHPNSKSSTDVTADEKKPTPEA